MGANLGQSGAITARQWLSLGLLLATLIAAILLGYLVFDTSVDKSSANWGKALIFLLGVLAATATIIVNWTAPKDARWTGIATPDKAAIALIAVFAAFGAMTDALSLLSPRQVVEDEPLLIQNTVLGTDAKLDELTRLLRERFPGDPPILDRIGGRWGNVQTGCETILKIEIVRREDNAALVAEVVKAAPGIAPYRFVGELIAARGDRLDVTGVEPEGARGAAARFTYNDATGQLDWNDLARGSGGTEVYRRCA